MSSKHKAKIRNAGKEAAKAAVVVSAVEDFKRALKALGRCPMRGEKVEWATLFPVLTKGARDDLSRILNKFRHKVEWAEIMQECNVDDPDAYDGDQDLDGPPPLAGPQSMCSCLSMLLVADCVVLLQSLEAMEGKGLLELLPLSMHKLKQTYINLE